MACNSSAKFYTLIWTLHTYTAVLTEFYKKTVSKFEWHYLMCVFSHVFEWAKIVKWQHCIADNLKTACDN